MKNSLLVIVLCFAAVTTIFAQSNLQSCTSQPLPLDKEEDLVRAVQCQFPEGRILRIVAKDEQYYWVRLLQDSGIEDILFDIATGDPVEPEED